MKRKIKIPLLLAVAVLFCALIPIAGYAAEKSEEVGFAVNANLPENQKNAGVSYFDLRMEPGQQQELTIEVYNENSDEIKVKVEAVSASTNANGNIDYKTSGIKDETLKTPFSEISEIKAPVLTIPGKQSRTAAVNVKMPEKEYDGVILGGIILTQVKEDTETQQTNEQQSQQGVYINNEYSYVLGVKLSETEKEISPEFQGIEAKPELMNYRVNIVHYIRNSEAAIAKETEISIDIYSQKEQQVIKSDQKVIDMAPNSVMPYAVSWGGEIAPGKYVSNVTMKQGEYEQKFELPFEVSAQTAQQINNESVEVKQMIPWWVVLMIALIIILLVIIIVLLAAAKQKKKKDDDGSDETTRAGRRRRK